MMKKQQTKRSLYSVKQFIETVKGMPKYHDISDVTFAGFYNKMKTMDRLYTFDPQFYVKALEEYITKQERNDLQMVSIVPASKTMKLIYPKSYNSRPHVTTEYDDSALTNQASESAKNIFLLGSATEGDPSKIYEVKSSVQARAIFGSGDLVQAMELIWNPDGEFFQNGGTVYAQRVENAQQASMTEGPLVFTSKIFGSCANKIGISLTKDAVSNAYRLHVEYDPKTYSNNYNNIGNIFQLYYGGSSVLAKAYGYRVEGSDIEATKFILATGDSQSSLQPVQEFDLTTDAYNNMEKLLTAIEEVPGFQAAALKSCASIDTKTLDVTPGNGFVPIGDQKNPTIVTDFFGDLIYSTRNDPYVKITVNKFQQPANVNATAGSNGVTITADPVMQDVQVFNNQYLAGGDDGHVPLSWADKFQSVHGQNIYYIVPLTAEENIHAELQEFLDEENTLGYNYMSFVGGGFNEDFNTIVNRQLALRSNRIALVANSGTYNDLRGVNVHIPAYMMAAYVAGVASSLPIGSSVTHKYLSLTSLDQNFTGDELNQLDDNGVIAIENVVNRDASGGYRIVEDVTTANSSNEPVKNLVSLQELTDFLFDDLRYFLEDNFIGTPVHQVTGSLLVSNIEAYLQRRVNEGMLASYDRDKIQATVYGNQAYVSFSCAPARALREILVRGTYVNFSSSTNSVDGQTSYSSGISPDTTSVAGLGANS